MQLCQDHWHELIEAIRLRGLGRLVPAEVEAAGCRGIPQAADPLSMARALISEQAVAALGPYLLTRRYCPLCEVEDNLGRGLSFEWIHTDADAVLELCRARDTAESD